MTSSSTSASERWTADRVRSTFVEYFQQRHGHIFAPSSSTIPFEDPTLLFANAGMNQFKPIFLSTVDPNSERATWKRAVNTQKCIRAGGKHNDLDDVGKDTYHHTFFEMLGNWSFGDYFKAEATAWAWDLLTNVYKLDRERLYVTYFGGDERTGLAPDSETRDLWLSLGLPEDRVLPFGMKDNFWEMGETGPCGPCSEIHFDRVGSRSGGRDPAALVNQDDPNVLEIWNLVFIQYNREDDGSLRPLPAKHVDTGMGLERLVSVLQNTYSNYDTDVFLPLFDAIRDYVTADGKQALPPYQRTVLDAPSDEAAERINVAYRVLADHARTLTVALSDGGVPHIDGRGYVLRRILRRAVRYASEVLHARPGLLSHLLPVVQKQLASQYLPLNVKLEELKSVMDEEEAQFAKTLQRGLHHFHATVKHLPPGSRVLPGADIWKLYDTYGFPVDLTRLMALERGLELDEPGMHAAMETSKLISKGEAHKTGEKVAGARDAVVLDVHHLAWLKERRTPLTHDAFKYDPQQAQLEAAVLHVFYDNAFHESTARWSGEYHFGLLLDKTNFYAESGGQIFDTGVIATASGPLDVVDTQVYGGYVLHTCKSQGSLDLPVKRGASVTVAYDWDRRSAIMNNHTATHLLNFALRDVLEYGHAQAEIASPRNTLEDSLKRAALESIDQKGSLVSPDKLRFDFACKKGITKEQLRSIEVCVQRVIEQDAPVYASEAPLGPAKEIEGLRAVFDETYPDPVRVVSIGQKVEDLLADPKNAEWTGTSVEFCGGTHVARTGCITSFAITQEQGIAKGIRRIIAVTSEEANAAHALADQYAERISAALALEGKRQDDTLARLVTELEQYTLPFIRKAEFREQIEAGRKAFAVADRNRKMREVKETTAFVKKTFETNPEKGFLCHLLDVNGNAKALAAATAGVKALQKCGCFLAVDTAANKLLYQCYAPKSSPINASEWVTVIDGMTGGVSGGKDELRQGQAALPHGLADMVAAMARWAETKLSQ